MSVVVRLDQLEGSRAIKTISGWEFTRPAFVSGIEGDGVDRLIAAVDAVIAIVGDCGSEHPSKPEAKIESFLPHPASSEEIRVDIEYRMSNFAIPANHSIIEVGSSLSQEETNRDVNGVGITLTYTYPTTYTTNRDRVIDPTIPPTTPPTFRTFAERTVTQTGFVSRLIPESTVIITRREFVSPGLNARLYVGKVNSTGWDNIDPGCPPRVWLCMRIVGRSDDGGLSFNTTYEFGYREDNWDPTAVFINPDDGATTPDRIVHVPGQPIPPICGERRVQVYRVANFSALLLGQ